MLPRASSKNADLEKPGRYSIQKITSFGAGKKNPAKIGNKQMTEQHPTSGFVIVVPVTS
jgi:hypothetical protein